MQNKSFKNPNLDEKFENKLFIRLTLRSGWFEMSEKSPQNMFFIKYLSAAMLITPGDQGGGYPPPPSNRDPSRRKVSSTLIALYALFRGRVIFNAPANYIFHITTVKWKKDTISYRWKLNITQCYLLGRNFSPVHWNSVSAGFTVKFLFPS